jgi:hypothetical protein
MKYNLTKIEKQKHNTFIENKTKKNKKSQNGPVNSYYDLAASMRFSLKTGS